MPFRNVDEMLQPDPRYKDLVVVRDGVARALTMADHHSSVAEIDLTRDVPVDVRAAFDRARNILLYAWIDYDLLVVGESQAFAAFELALKRCMNDKGMPGKGTLRNLIDQARKRKILPPLMNRTNSLIDPIEALLLMRNALAHGTTDIHSPAMALQVVDACAAVIDELFSQPQAGR